MSKEEPKNKKIVKTLLSKYPCDNTMKPSEFINYYMAKYNNENESNSSLNGAVFENLVILALHLNGIKNIYFQTELSYVPSAIFDAFLYSENISIAISIKTSLRERWKQADLEALAIKQVHKNAKCYLLTLSAKEVAARRKNDTSYAGLDGFILADTEEFDNFVSNLQSVNFTTAGNFPIVITEEKIYTKEMIFNDFGIK